MMKGAKNMTVQKQRNGETREVLIAWLKSLPENERNIRFWIADNDAKRMQTSILRTLGEQYIEWLEIQTHE